MKGSVVVRPWRFIHATDIHVGSPRSFRFEPAWNENWQTARQQIIELAPDLLLVGGDLARDGSFHRWELEAVKADLDSLPFPTHVVPGNMDTGNKHTEVSSQRRDDVSLNLTSEQVAQFRDVFGPTEWSFVRRGVRFSGFCDMVAVSGLPEEAALWAWLEAQGGEPCARHHVWLMHSPPFLHDPSEPNADITDRAQYHTWYFGIDEPQRSRLLDVFRATAADLVFCGHVHCRKTHIVDGIRLDIGASTAFAQQAGRWPDGDPTLGFAVYEVSDAGIEHRFVPLARVSDAKGYGPGGHPPPEARDYSLAWET